MPGGRDDFQLRPIVGRDAAGLPVFSLTILLDRRPEPTDETIVPIVRQATLSLEVALVPAGARTPTFIREARFALRGGTRSLADTVSSGTLPRGSLTAVLDRRDATDVLAALDGSPSTLTLDVTMLHRVATPPATLHLAGSWPKIYDFLAARIPASGFARDELRESVDELLQAGVLLASGPAGTPFEPIFDLFMRVAPVVLKLDVEQRYVLRDRPSNRFELAIQTTVAGAGEASAALALPLDRLLGGLLDDLDRDAFIKLVSPDGDGGIGPAPRRVRTLAPDRPRSVDGRAPRSDVIAADGRFHSLAAALRPMHATASPAALVATGALTPARAGHSWWVDDTSVVDGGDVRPLPIVDDEGAALWHDRLDGGTYWYAPAFELVLPDPTEAASTSPFLYTFSEAGATSSGERGLDATVKATLRRQIPDAVTAALEQLGNPSAQPVVPTALSVSFELPFRDEHGVTQTQLFAAGVEQDGDLLTATIALIDDWARLCYGSLAVAGFQSAPARLTVTYSFEAYVPCGAGDLRLLLGGKTATTEVVYAVAPEPVVRQPCFDASQLAYRFPAGEVRLTPEPAGAVRARLDRTSLLHAEAVPLAVARPQLSAVALGPFRRTRYASRSIVRQEQLDALVPCNTYGAFYVQNLPSGPEAVGCRDALKLGETTWRQFEEIPELRDALYSVHRSLQQPGRFLVVPSAYRIARFAATEGDRAYRPIVFVYSTLDGANPTNDRVLFQFVVQPDVPPYARRRLLDRLRAYAADPVLLYPTELEADTEYHWTIAAALDVEPQAVKFPDSLQITLATDLTGALLVRDVLRNVGVAATAAFALPDGSPKLSVAIDLSLTRLTGPWDGGPVDVTILADSVLLTNRIERPVDVGDLLAYAASGPPTVVAVDATLEPASSRAVAVMPGTAEAVPVTSVPQAPAADLEEIRSFVEDVLINVVFVDLVDHAGHDISGIEVEARMKSAPDPTLQVPMTGSPAVGQVEFTLPLTTYLADRTLEFRSTAAPTGGDPVPGPWRAWDLTTRGNVVSLVWGETVS